MDEATQALFLATPEEADDPRPEAMLAAIEARGGKSAFLKYLKGLGGRLSRDAILAAIATTISWGPLMRKRITRLTAETLPWYLRLYGVMVGATIPGEHHQSGSLRGIPRDERFGQWTMADLCFLAMTGKKPTPEEALPLQILVGLLISNGPGSISAQGAKGAVSADGPQTPGRVQINKAMVGFLTHTGYSHGGNGFEGMAFLLDQFKDTGLKDPSDPAHGLDLKAMATEFAKAYRREKKASKEVGAELRALPGVHHPIFKGKPVNHDPRERFVAEYMARAGRYNVFHAFYRELVQALYEQGASPYVFCVNVDAVIAALLLALLWPDYQAGRLTRARPRDGGLHRLPLRADDRVGGGDRRPPEPRPQHGHPDPGLGLRVRGLMDGAGHPAGRGAGDPHHRDAGRHQPRRRHLRRLADEPDGPRRRQPGGADRPGQGGDHRGGRHALPPAGEGGRRGVAVRQHHQAGADVDAHPRHRLAPQPTRRREPEGDLRHLRLRRPRRRGPAAPDPGLRTRPLRGGRRSPASVRGNARASPYRA